MEEPEARPPPPLLADPATIGAVGRSAMARLAAHPATTRPSVLLRLAWAGSFVLLVLLIVMAFALRSEIIALWPASARAYTALGLYPQPETSQ
jgi:hypothetical protein